MKSLIIYTSLTISTTIILTIYCDLFDEFEYDILFPISALIALYLFTTCKENPGIVSINENITTDSLLVTKNNSPSYNNTAIMDFENFQNPSFPIKHFCSICYIDQEYRSKHCKQCNKCIYTYDHHCYWIGNFNINILITIVFFLKGTCVGEFNRGRFFFFLFFQTIVTLWSFLLVNLFISLFNFLSF